MAADREAREREVQCAARVGLRLEPAGRLSHRRQCFAEQNPDTVKKLLRATAKGYRDAMVDPKAAAKTMAKYMKVPEDPEVLDRQVEATVVSTNAPAGKPIGWQESADWQANLTLLKETGGLPEIKPLSAYYTNDYLQ